MVDDSLSEYNIGRFWERVRKPRENGAPGCWEWDGVTSDGRGKLRVNGKDIKAHRLSMWVHTGKPVPDGVLVCHHCDNPACVRPDHLYYGSVASNMADRARRGRVKHKWNTRQFETLTEAEKRDICERLDRFESIPVIMAAYNISGASVASIRYWRWRRV